MWIRRTLAMLAASTLVLAACGGDGSKKSVSTDQGSVTVEGKGKDTKISVDTDKGSASFGAGTELPNDFPSEVPTPKGLELQSAVSADNGATFSMSYKVKASEINAAIDDYRGALKDAGFSIDDSGSVNIGGTEINGLRATGHGWTVSTSSVTGAANVLVIAVAKESGG